MIAVVFKKHPQRNRLQQYKRKQYKIGSDEKKNVAHLKKNNGTRMRTQGKGFRAQDQGSRDKEKGSGFQKLICSFSPDPFAQFLSHNKWIAFIVF
jgi:hypothetical protein